MRLKLQCVFLLSTLAIAAAQSISAIKDDGDNDAVRVKSPNVPASDSKPESSPSASPSANPSPAPATTMTLDALQESVTAGFKAREALLRFSTGTAHLEFSKTRSARSEKNLKDRAQAELGMKPERMKVSGSNEWDVAWYIKGPNLRYDVVVPEMPQGQQSYMTPQNYSLSADAEKCYAYDKLHQEAYISRPPMTAANPASFASHFNFLEFYRLFKSDVPEIFSSIKKDHLKYAISNEKVSGVNCIQVKVIIDPLIYDQNRKTQCSYWFAPEYSHSLVKYIFRVTTTINNQELLALERDYCALYQDSKTHPGIWTIKELTLQDIDTESSEILHVKFGNINIGVETGDALYSFEGMGVKKGATIYDVRTRGETKRLIFGSDEIK